MKVICAKCKKPLERDKHTGAFICRSCGDAVTPDISQPHRPPKASSTALLRAVAEDGRCPTCKRELEYDANNKKFSCPMCDTAPDFREPGRRSSSPVGQCKKCGKTLEFNLELARLCCPSCEPGTGSQPAVTGPVTGENPAEMPETGEPGKLIATARSEGECRVLTFKGQVGEMQYNDFRDAVRDGINSGAVRMIVDFGNMTYMSSSGLSVLLWAHHEMISKGRRLIMVNIHPRVGRLIQMINVDQVLEMADSVKQAIELPD